jgi:hypothetical protein
MVLQTCTDVKKEVRGLFGETFLVFCDADQAKNIKAEEGSDVVEEEDPMPITFPKLKAAPEVSSVSMSVNMKQLHYAVDWIFKSFF